MAGVGVSGIKRTPADAAFSDCVRERADWTCQHCKKSDGRMECAHIYGRRAAITRWEGMNAVCLCHGCHRAFTENPADFMAWLDKEMGEGYMQILNEKRRGILKNNAATRKEVAAHYREQHKNMRAKRESGVVGWLDFLSYQ